MAEGFQKRVIVGGLPRSGSTLLRFLLDGSPGMIAGPETAFFAGPLWQHQQAVDRLATRLGAKLELSPEVVSDAVMRSTSSVEAFDVIMSAFAEGSAPGRGPSVWVEKSPTNCFHYARIASEDPNVFFISTVRDGRDVVTSIMDGEAEYWCPVQRFVDTARAVLGFQSDRHRVLRYEDLVSDPATVLGSLMDWMGERYDPGALAFDRTVAATRSLDKVRQPKLAGPISCRWVGRWREPEHRARVASFEAHPDAATLDQLLGAAA